MIQRARKEASIPVMASINCISASEWVDFAERIHDARAATKLLLAGADAVMVCSALCLNGPEYLKQLIDGLAEWMDTHHFKSIGDFKGGMNYAKIENPSIYERSQFMRYFSNFH